MEEFSVINGSNIIKDGIYNVHFNTTGKLFYKVKYVNKKEVGLYLENDTNGMVFIKSRYSHNGKDVLEGIHLEYN